MNYHITQAFLKFGESTKFPTKIPKPPLEEYPCSWFVGVGGFRFVYDSPKEDHQVMGISISLQTELLPDDSVKVTAKGDLYDASGHSILKTGMEESGVTVSYLLVCMDPDAPSVQSVYGLSQFSLAHAQGDHNLQCFQMELNEMSGGTSATGICRLNDDSHHIAEGPAFGSALRVPDYVILDKAKRGPKTKEGLYGINFIKSFVFQNTHSDSHVRRLSVDTGVDENGEPEVHMYLEDNGGNCLNAKKSACAVTTIYPEKNAG